MSGVTSQREVTVVELLDRLLDKGVVLAGDVTISVANVPLIYLGLRVLLSSTETAERFGAPVPGGRSLQSDALDADAQGTATDVDALDADALDGDALRSDAGNGGTPGSATGGQALSDEAFPPGQPDAGGIQPGGGDR